ncbi:Pentatricopeptide repeat-containing protein [Nymphaea thermarum]|nr:Pentatricopeptide repeat-containing protein [Nymphaea thermarum]
MPSSATVRHSRRLFGNLILRLTCSTSQASRFQKPHGPSTSQHRLVSISSFSSHSAPISTQSAAHEKILLAELVSEKKWSNETEKALDGAGFPLTHETVVYVLKKLEGNPRKALDFFEWVQEKKGLSISPVSYDILIRIAAHKDFMKEFWRIVKEMQDRGLVVDEETYQNILTRFVKERMVNEAAAWKQLKSLMQEKSTLRTNVESVVGIISGWDWNEQVEAQLGSLDLQFSDVLVIRVLRELRALPLKALNFFRWVGRQPDYRHTATTYGSIVRVLGRSDSIEEFWNSVREMKDEGFELDFDTYIKLARRFQKWKMMKDAVDLYEFMMEGPYKPSMQDCSLLLQQIALSGLPDMDLVFRVVQIFEKGGNSLSKSVYDGIHRSLTSVGRFDEANQIMKTMKNAGFEPDNITYSQLVFGLCKAGRLEEARKMLDEMEEHGCTPDLKTWTILIQGHFLVGEVNQALSCFTRMLEKNCDADADLIAVMVKGLCDKNRVVDAYTILVEIVETGNLRPWQATYKLLIERLLKNGRLEEGLKLLNLMKSHGLPPFPEPFVNYISKRGTVEDGMDFLKALTVKRFPSTSAHVHLLQAFFKEGRNPEAQDLLYKFPHHIRNHADVLSLFGSSNPKGKAAA